MPASTQSHIEFTTEDLQKFIIEPLQAASVIEAAGPMFLDSPQGVPVRIPEIADFDDPDPDMYAENELIADSEMTPGERILLPATLKSAKSISRMSNELIRHSPLALLQAVSTQQVRRIAKQLDQKFINGTATPDGNGNHDPKGLLVQAGIQSETWDATPADSDTMLDPISNAVGKLLTAELEDSSRWRLIIPPAVFTAFDKVKDADGKPVLTPDPTQPTRRTIKGIPVSVSSKMPAATGLLVDFAQVVVARDLQPQVKVLAERWADYDQTGVRVVSRADIGLLHAEGVVKLTEA